MKTQSARFLCFALLLVLVAFSIRVADSASAQARSFSVGIATPAEGETFYAGPSSLLYNTPISGWIIAPDLETVDVRLELLQNGELVGSQVTKPHQDGTFKFLVTINPGASIGNFPAELRSCDSCHHRTELGLPSGDLLIRVTAMNAAGQEAAAERRITVDRAGSAVVPVRVVRADNPDEVIANVPVSASTRLYLWRTRHAKALSSGADFVDVSVEALSEAPTRYVFRVEPGVVDGVYYESTEAVEVVLPPGATEAPPITIKVRSETGHISGRVVTPSEALPSPSTVWAIRLPYGPFFRTDVAGNGSFAFPDLPVDAYLITLDWQTLRQQGLSGTEQRLDLSQNPDASIELPLTPAGDVTVSGEVQDTNGVPLPFAWISAEASDSCARVQPATGNFTLAGLSDQPQTLQISAPGFYSQAHVYDPGNADGSPLQIRLTPRPEMEHISWGEGEIVVPPESSVRVDGRSITLESGWLWGTGNDEHPLPIRHGDVLISLRQASFALAARPGNGAWLYVFAGEAEIMNGDHPEPVLVTADQMVRLPSDNSQPVPLPIDPVVSDALRPEPESPLSAAWQPGLRAQLRDRLALIGINSAKVITSVTYFLVLLSMVALPVYGLFLWLKKQN